MSINTFSGTPPKVDERTLQAKELARLLLGQPANSTTRAPLSPLAVALISDAISSSGNSPYVFPSSSTDNAITAHAATRAIGRARPELWLAHFRVHDLRRTVATGMASLGVNPHTISLVLDHISVTKGTVTSAVYVKYSFDESERRWSDGQRISMGWLVEPGAS